MTTQLGLMRKMWVTRRANSTRDALDHSLLTHSGSFATLAAIRRASAELSTKLINEGARRCQI